MDIYEVLSQLATIKGDARADERRIALYAERLSRFPDWLTWAACQRLMDDESPHFPALGAIFGTFRDLLAEKGGVMGKEEAWKVAQREVARFHPVTRPLLRFSHPALGDAVEGVGGVSAFNCRKWSDRANGYVDDDTALDILRKRFMEAYWTSAAKPDYLLYSIERGKRTPAPILSLELPPEQAEMLALEADARGISLPGRLVEPVVVQPSTLAAPAPPLPLPQRAQDPEEQARRAATVARGIEAIARGMRGDRDERERAN